ncbi:MAG: DUF2177 family protein [Pseudomonadota bacterium]
MQILTLYFVTVLVFLAVDIVGLKLFLKPLFDRHLGDWMLEDPKLAPAAAFYLFYIVGVVYFVSLPALAEGGVVKALLTGAFLGAVAYGTYEFTNYATLTRWSLEMVLTDVIWGAFLTAISAAAGVAVVKALWN